MIARHQRLNGRLLSSTVFASAIIWAAPAYAQPGTAAGQGQIPAQEEAAAEAGQATNDPESGQAIVVTGSRIQSPTITSVSPVQVISDVEIDQSGVTTIQDLLNENPAFGSQGSVARTTTAFTSTVAGAATVDLRNLGTDRTLVLINGRRVVPGFAGSATVDVNMIPTQFIQRIDTLTGGASSLYGSDAIAGVVNFIYKQDFEGIEINGQYGLTQQGDDAQYQVNAIVGGNFGDDRGNILLHFGYTNQEGLGSRKRKNTFTDDTSLFPFTQDPEDFAEVLEPFFSSFPPQGRFIVDPTNAATGTFTFDRNNNLLNCFSSNGTTCGGQPNGFNRQFFRTIAVPVERYVLASRAHYDITDAIRVFGEFTYNNTKNSSEIEPFASSSTNPNGIFPATEVMPLQTVVDGIVRRVAFVPDAIFNAAQDLDGDGLKDIGFTRRLVELGTRNSLAERDIFRAVVGVEGDLFNDAFHWDISYNYGRASQNQRNSGQVNVPSFRQALNAIVDTTDLDADGNTTEIICADQTARAEGCVPANIFGFNSISPGAANYIQAQGSFQSRITQQVVTANLSGSLLELPAGPLGIAVGAEYRREASSSDFDALTNAGLNGGNALPDTQGSFDVREA